MSPIQVATPLFITDCKVAWKIKIEKTRLQEGLNKKSNCRFFNIAQPDLPPELVPHVKLGFSIRHGAGASG
jgi:hypothetical protein